MDYITACAIVKDEGDYLLEWIVYHRLLGVTHFVLYDNGSQVPVEQTVRLFAKHDDIEVVSFPGTGPPGRGRQNQAYMDCFSRVSGETVWLTLTDIDEFIVPIEDPDLVVLLQRFDKYGALGVNWQTFGSSSHREKPTGLQIENFRYRTPVQWEWNRHIKSIVRPERTKRALSSHFCTYRDGWWCVNENEEPVIGPHNDPVSTQQVQLNHYFTRSLAEYQLKVARGSGDGTAKREQSFRDVDAAAVEPDDAILRFVPRVRTAISAA
ncbi:MAG: glycosyltransferase family 92 protein [Streptosporangiaceae bacterium]|nr:glycosyltransferase family 92 protein [Streptosporangiaceae bacterium]